MCVDVGRIRPGQWLGWSHLGATEGCLPWTFTPPLGVSCLSRATIRERQRGCSG